MNIDPFDSLKQCNSLHSLNAFVDKLGENPLTPQQCQILEQKVTDLYEEGKKQFKKETPLYEETIILLASLKQINVTKSQGVFNKLFTDNNKIIKIEKECINNIRNDKSRMEKLTENYNKIASNLNLMIESKESEKIDEEFLKREFKQLKFLNNFLGIPWSKAQEEGKLPVPLMTRTSFSLSSMKDIKSSPQECQTLEELFAFSQHLFENKQEIHQKLKIEEHMLQRSLPPQNSKKGEIQKKLQTASVENMYTSFLQRLQNLLHKGETHAYHKIPLYWQASASLHMMEQTLPEMTLKYANDFKSIKDFCIHKIKEDKPTLAIITQNWNNITEDWNTDILFNCIEKTEKPHTNLSIPQKEQLKFLAPFFDVSIDLALEDKPVILPTIYKNDSVGGMLELQSEYNFLGSLINHEILLREKTKDLNEIQLALQNPYVQSFLSSEEIQRLKQREIECKSELCVSPSLLAEETFQSLLTEMDRVSSFMGIQLSKDQITGKIPIPLIGHTENPKPNLVMSELAKPSHLKTFKFILKEINRFIQLREKEKEYYLLSTELQNYSIFSKEKEGDEKIPEKRKRYKVLRKELLELRKTAFFKGNERLFERKLGQALYLNQLYHFISLDEMQEKGMKEWPILNSKETLQIPSDDILINELQSISPEVIMQWANNWPKGWREHVLEFIESKK